MHSENGVLVDFDEITKVIEAADVLTVGFANFPERLLIDARSNERERPFVQVVEPTGSARERLRWLQRRRPSLGVPQAFSFIYWPHSPSFLVESGVWRRICRRAGADEDPAVRTQCDLAIAQLQNLDEELTLSLLKGERCVTLWPRPPKGAEEEHPS